MHSFVTNTIVLLFVASLHLTMAATHNLLEQFSSVKLSIGKKNRNWCKYRCNWNKRVAISSLRMVCFSHSPTSSSWISNLPTNLPRKWRAGLSFQFSTGLSFIDLKLDFFPTTKKPYTFSELAALPRMQRKSDTITTEKANNKKGKILH